MGYLQSLEHYGYAPAAPFGAPSPSPTPSPALKWEEEQRQQIAQREEQVAAQLSDLYKAGNTNGGGASSSGGIRERAGMGLVAGAPVPTAAGAAPTIRALGMSQIKEEMSKLMANAVAWSKHNKGEGEGASR